MSKKFNIEELEHIIRSVIDLHDYGCAKNDQYNITNIDVLI